MRYSLILIAALSAATAFADPQSSGGGGQVSMDNLTKALQLDPQQATQVEQILNDERAQLQQLKGSGGGSSSGGNSSGNSDARAQLQSIHQDTISKLQGVLNDQQMEKFQRMVQERRQSRHGGGQRGAARQHQGAQQAPAQSSSSQPQS